MNWLRKLFGVSKCATLAELRAYIKPGDLSGLWNWVSWWIPYRKDRHADDNFRPGEDVLRRAAQGTGDDCEGIHGVAHAVISSWAGWTAGLVALTRPQPPNHAVCVFVMPDGVKGYIDYGIHIFPNTEDWGDIFSFIPGEWTGAHWVNADGTRANIAGWTRKI